MIRLNLGGGNFRQDGWLNVDYPFPCQEKKRDHNLIDIAHNFMLMKPISLSDGSVDVAYSEHCIEHLTDEAVEFLLKDVFRMMRHGSILRISCPDADIVYDHYKNSNEPLGFNKRRERDGRETELLDILATPLIGKVTDDWVQQRFIMFEKDFFLNCLTDELMILNITKEDQANSPGAHLSWWNWDKLNRVLGGIGFRKIKLRGQRESQCEDLCADWVDRTANKYSIRVECGK